MAEITKQEPQESSSDTETVSLEQHTPSIKGNKRKPPCQLNDKEKEKVQKIVSKVKLALEQNADKRRKGRKSMILVCYYRRGKKPNEVQVKEEEEDEETPESSEMSESSSASTALCQLGHRDLAVSTMSPKKALEKWSGV
ncbi:hypothetical protein CB1_000822001 [Camelus ferus]|nr:hypothetical protein CB1_000822001 [Camelus ferus]